MKTILKLLNKTEDQYFDMYFGDYWRWCESVSINDEQHQMVLANAAVDKYYRMEYDKCEAEFLLLAKNYPDINPDDAVELYIKCTVAMFNRRCEPVIKKAKTNYIHNDTATIN